MRFSLVFFLLLIFVEVWSIIQVGHYVGALATVILLIAGFILGSKLLRFQGIQSAMKSAQTMQAGESPLAPLADGVLKAFAAILFMVPGFVSDVIALILLIPFVRKYLVKKLLTKAQFQGFAAGNFGGGFGGVFGAGGFTPYGKPGANDEFAGGNVYEHEESPNTSKLINEKDKAEEATIIEFKPKNK